MTTTTTTLSHELPPPTSSPSLWARIKQVLFPRSITSSSEPSLELPPNVFPLSKHTPLYAPAHIGGKAYNMIRLLKMPKVLIPSALVISTSEFDSAMAQSASSPAISQESRIILSSFLKAESRYAVRSSADVEDSGDSAMAGMFLTVLNVKGNLVDVEKAVIQCWKSTQGEALQNVQPKPRMAVVIMEQIDSEKSGVLFMANPVTKSTHSWVINATYGQGEGVVGGTLPVDTITLSADQSHAIRKQRIATKTAKLTLVDNGTVQVDVLADLQDKACLSEQEISMIVEAGKSILAHSSCPQDVEFAFFQGKLFILQTRPITTLSAQLKWTAPEPGLFQLNGHMARPLSRFYQPCYLNGHVTGVLKLSNDIGLFAWCFFDCYEKGQKKVCD